MKTVRNTKKSRLVSEFSECVSLMVIDGITAPSKSQIVDCVARASLDESVSVAIKTMLEDELANELERYFPDVCKAAQEVLDAPFHLVNAEFYKKSRKSLAKSKAVARTQVATFGNGRTGKAKGVRFVMQTSSVDIYLAIVAEKRQNTTNCIIKNTNEFLVGAVESGALPPANTKHLAKPSK